MANQQPRYAARSWPVSRLFLLLAFVFFVLDTLILGDVVTATGMSWLLPAGLTSWSLAMLVP